MGLKSFLIGSGARGVIGLLVGLRCDVPYHQIPT